MNRPVRLRVFDHVIAVQVADETVVWVESTGALHLLDGPASAVLQLCDGNLTEGAMTQVLLERYEATPSTISSDVERLLEAFEAIGIIERWRA